MGTGGQSRGQPRSRSAAVVARGLAALALAAVAALLVRSEGSSWGAGLGLQELWQLGFLGCLVGGVLMLLGVPHVGRLLGWLPAATTLVFALWFLLEPAEVIADNRDDLGGRWQVDSEGQAIAIGVLLLGVSVLFAGTYAVVLRYPADSTRGRQRRRGLGRRSSGAPR